MKRYLEPAIKENWRSLVELDPDNRAQRDHRTRYRFFLLALTTERANSSKRMCKHLERPPRVCRGGVACPGHACVMYFVSSRLASLQRETLANFARRLRNFVESMLETRVETLPSTHVPLSLYVSLRCTPRFLPTNGPIHRESPSFSFRLSTQHGAHNAPSVSPSCLSFQTTHCVWWPPRDFTSLGRAPLQLDQPRLARK